MTSCPRCGRYTTAPTHCGADVGQAAVCGCSHAAMSHSYTPELRRNTGRCLGLGCGCSAYVESGGKALGMGGLSVAECDNNGTAKGRIALTNPTLLATVSTRPKGA